MDIKKTVISNIELAPTVSVKLQKEMIENMVKDYMDIVHNVKNEFDLNIFFDQGYDVELVFEPSEDDSDIKIQEEFKKIYPDNKTIITTAIADTLETKEFNIDIFPDDKDGKGYRVEMPYHVLEKIKNMKASVE